VIGAVASLVLFICGMFAVKNGVGLLEKLWVAQMRFNLDEVWINTTGRRAFRSINRIYGLRPLHG
jgi:hypothetical protein